MYRMLRLTIASAAIALAGCPTNVIAQAPAAQIMLTEKNVEGFIAAVQGCGEPLIEHFPVGEGDRNELPNHLIEI